MGLARTRGGAGASTPGAAPRLCRLLSVGSCHLAQAPENLLDSETQHVGPAAQEPADLEPEGTSDLEGTTLEMGPPEEEPLVAPAQQAPADLLGTLAPAHLNLALAGLATQAPAEGPGSPSLTQLFAQAGHVEVPCSCCYYNMLNVDPEDDPTFATCGWFWSRRHESWVWWHGRAPHVPFHMPFPHDDQAPDLLENPAEWA